MRQLHTTVPASGAHDGTNVPGGFNVMPKKPSDTTEEFWAVDGENALMLGYFRSIAKRVQRRDQLAVVLEARPRVREALVLEQVRPPDRRGEALPVDRRVDQVQDAETKQE